jgi:hypothetical protein
LRFKSAISKVFAHAKYSDYRATSGFGDQPQDLFSSQDSRHARFRLGATLWRHNFKSEPGRSPQLQAISKGLYVSAHKEGCRGFEITICNLNKEGRGGRRYLPYAFTEHGIAMLSSVLHSDRAVQVNIAIMRAFLQLRAMLATHEDLRRKIIEMEKRFDSKFHAVFAALRQMLETLIPPKRQIGFHSRTRLA